MATWTPPSFKQKSWSSSTVSTCSLARLTLEAAKSVPKSVKPSPITSFTAPSAVQSVPHWFTKSIQLSTSASSLLFPFAAWLPEAMSDAMNVENDWIPELPSSSANKSKWRRTTRPYPKKSNKNLPLWTKSGLWTLDTWSTWLLQVSKSIFAEYIPPFAVKNWEKWRTGEALIKRGCKLECNYKNWIL